MSTLSTKSKAILLMAPAAVIGAAAFAVLPAGAATESANYHATLSPVPLSHVTGSGDVTVQLNGHTATVTEHVSGLAKTFGGNPYPHVQHIHGPDASLGAGGMGKCPSASADSSGDGVVNTTEGQPAYGPILSTLSTTGDTSPKAATTLTVAPSGDSFTYTRTFALDSSTMSALTSGKAVVVVHGEDPATLSKRVQGEKSELVPSLPLAATNPALCGVLHASQMTSVPVGSSPTGGGSTAGLQDEGLLLAGGVLVLAAGGVFATRRRLAHNG